MRPRFHLAFPVHDLDATRAFYAALGAKEGRAAERWVDFDFFGHQLSAHVDPSGPATKLPASSTNQVDGDQVPVRHFGVILPWAEWESLHNRLQAAGVEFRIRPKVRFEDQPGEQGTFFLDDPSGNVLEFKTFREDSSVFAT